MKPEKEIDLHTRNYVPYSFQQVPGVGSLKSPANLVTLKKQEPGLQFIVLIQEDLNI